MQDYPRKICKDHFVSWKKVAVAGGLILVSLLGIAWTGGVMITNINRDVQQVKRENGEIKRIWDDTKEIKQLLYEIDTKLKER